MNGKSRAIGRLWLGVFGLAFAAAPLIAQDPTPPFLGIKVISNGNVGVGTQTPQAPLHVNGNALVSGTLLGGGVNGLYNNAAVVQGYATSGAASSPFIFQYLDNVPGQVPQIHILNTATNVFKNFIIDDPVDKQRYLVHATLEGPEGAVYYRGSARLVHGRARIVLPHYFESLTRREGRTIQLTNVDGFDPLAVATQRGDRIVDGAFSVVSRNRASHQAFDWEVKAVRSDAPPLEAEPLKSDISVGGFGPYTFIADKR